MPSRPLLCGLLLLAVAPPFVARAFGSGPFAFAMFTEVERYHLELVYVRTALACGLLVGLRSRWCAAGLAPEPRLSPMWTLVVRLV